MTAKIKKLLGLFMYFLLGCILCNNNGNAGIVFFSALPFHIWLVRFFYMRNHYVFTLFSFILLIAIGLNSVIFFLNEEVDTYDGMDFLVKSDKFSLFFHAYSQILLFCLTIVLLSLKFKNRNSINILKGSFSIVYDQFGRVSSSYIVTWFIIILVPLMSYVSIWMYNHNLGILGLQQTVLPYHMTGLLFYSRRFIFPLLLLFLFMKSPHKWFSFCLISIYAIISSVSGSSKSLGLLITIPFIIMSFGYRRNLMGIISIILSIFIFVFVTASRNLVYLDDTPLFTIGEVFTLSWELFKESDFNTLLAFVVSFTDRLYGVHLSVLGDHFNFTTLNEFISYYLGNSIGEVIPNFDLVIKGVVLPDDKAYGMGFGYLATMVLLASDNYFMVIFQAIILFVFFNYTERLVQRLFIASSSAYIKLGIMAVAAYMVMKLNDGGTLKPVYLSLVLLILLDRLLINRLLKHKGDFDNSSIVRDCI